MPTLLRYLFSNIVLNLSTKLSFQRNIHDEITVQCAKDLKIDLGKKDLAQNPEYKCILKCMLEKEGLMKDGHFVEDAIMKDIQDDTRLDAAAKEKFMKVVPTCLVSVENLTDICVKSFQFFECTHKDN